jgi:hypothetical protein
MKRIIITLRMWRDPGLRFSFARAWRTAARFAA